MRKPTQVRVRALSTIAPQVAEIMVKQLGITAIIKAYQGDRYQGIYALIRPELPGAVTDSEVWDVVNILNDKAKEAIAPMPYGVPGESWSIYLPE